MRILIETQLKDNNLELDYRTVDIVTRIKYMNLEVCVRNTCPNNSLAAVSV
jgi:hypothetical protein